MQKLLCIKRENGLLWKIRMKFFSLFFLFSRILNFDLFQLTYFFYLFKNSQELQVKPFISLYSKVALLSQKSLIIRQGYYCVIQFWKSNFFKTKKICLESTFADFFIEPFLHLNLTLQTSPKETLSKPLFQRIKLPFPLNNSVNNVFSTS